MSSRERKVNRNAVLSLVYIGAFSLVFIFFRGTESFIGFVFLITFAFLAIKSVLKYMRDLRGD